MSRGYVLIVEDDALIAQIAVNMLEAAGFFAESVENGKLALLALRARRPDLILLDANMPVMDGFDTLDAIKLDHDLRRIPVVMLTARRREDDVLRAKQLGASDYILKPLDARTLLGRVESILRRHRPLNPVVKPSASLGSDENGPQSDGPSPDIEIVD